MGRWSAALAQRNIVREGCERGGRGLERIFIDIDILKFLTLIQKETIVKIVDHRRFYNMART